MSRDFTDESAGSSEKHKETNSHKVCLSLFCQLKVGVERHLSNHKRSVFFFFKPIKISSCSHWEVSLVYSNEMIKKKRIQENNLESY